MTVNAGTKLVGKVHEKIAHSKRVFALAEILSTQLLPGDRVLDIGCGDGSIAALLIQRVPRIQIQGVEFQARADCKIACQPYDGAKLPFPDASLDVCMMVDVLHHTESPSVLLKEASRVTRSRLLIKDHLAENPLDRLTLKIMDWVGNRPYDVPLPYNYLSQEEWELAFSEARLVKANWTSKLPYYPGAARWLGLRRLHFVSLLEKSGSR